MDHLAYTIIDQMLKAKKALSFEQIANRCLGWNDIQLQAAIAGMERANLIKVSERGRNALYVPTIQGFTAWDTYLLATQDPTDLAGIE